MIERTFGLRSDLTVYGRQFPWGPSGSPRATRKPKNSYFLTLCDPAYCFHLICQHFKIKLLHTYSWICSFFQKIVRSDLGLVWFCLKKSVGFQLQSRIAQQSVITVPSSLYPLLATWPWFSLFLLHCSHSGQGSVAINDECLPYSFASDRIRKWSL